MAIVTVSNGAVLTAPAQDRKITPKAFLSRMTQPERIEIRNAASVNDEIYDFMDLLDKATYIDLDDQETIAGLNAIELAGLIGAGRAAEILNGEVAEFEMAKL